MYRSVWRTCLFLEETDPGRVCVCGLCGVTLLFVYTWTFSDKNRDKTEINFHKDSNNHEILINL